MERRSSGGKKKRNEEWQMSAESFQPPPRKNRDTGLGGLSSSIHSQTLPHWSSVPKGLVDPP